jgi:hypothetical protein
MLLSKKTYIWKLTQLKTNIHEKNYFRSFDVVGSFLVLFR